MTSYREAHRMASVVVALTVWDGLSRRKEGVFLVAAYAAAVLGFLFGGGR